MDILGNIEITLKNHGNSCVNFINGNVDGIELDLNQIMMETDFKNYLWVNKIEYEEMLIEHLNHELYHIIIRMVLCGDKIFDWDKKYEHKIIKLMCNSFEPDISFIGITPKKAKELFWQIMESYPAYLDYIKEYGDEDMYIDGLVSFAQMLEMVYQEFMRN